MADDHVDRVIVECEHRLQALGAKDREDGRLDDLCAKAIEVDRRLGAMLAEVERSKGTRVPFEFPTRTATPRAANHLELRTSDFPVRIISTG